MADQNILIVKNNHAGEEVWRYSGVLRRHTEKGLIIEAKFNAKDDAYGFKQGDLFIEAYLYGKWFNVYEIHSKEDGALKCWYCNITRPVRTLDQTLYYDDLALDLMVYPDGKMMVLDMDEFEELPISIADREKALKGLEELKKLFQEKTLINLSALI